MVSLLHDSIMLIGLDSFAARRHTLSPSNRRFPLPSMSTPRAAAIPLLLLLLITLLTPADERSASGGGGVRGAWAQTDCPLVGQGIDPYSAGLVNDKPPVYVSVLLKKLIAVDEVQYSYSAYFSIVTTWRDPRVNDTVAMNKVLSAMGPAITGLATANCMPNVTFSGFNISQKDECLKNTKQNNLPQVEGCSKKCTPAGITCCDALWIPSLTIPNVVLYPQDRYQTESIFFFGDYSTDASAVDRENIVEGTFSSPFTFRRFPFDSQVLRLVITVEGSGEFYLVGSNSGRQSEQGGGNLGGGGGTYVNDEVTGWKIASVALNCTPADTTVSSSASYHPEDPWNAIPDNTGSSSSSGAASNQSATCIFTIHIQRTSSVYVIAVLLPVILSVYLTFTAFVAKPEDLEIRLGACLTLFLALVAIQFVIDSQLPRTSAITNFGYLMIVSYIVIWLCTMETLVAFCIAERIEKNVEELVNDSLPPALSFKQRSAAADRAAGEKLMGAGEDGRGVDSNDPEAIAEAAAERRAAAAEEKQKKNVPGLLRFRLFGYHVRQSNPNRAKEGNYRLAVKIDVIVGLFLFTGYTITWIVLCTT